MNRPFSMSVGVLTLLLMAGGAHSAAGRAFTVAEEIGLAHFGDPYGAEAESVLTSPDGNFVAALTERGRLDLDRPEDTLRIYSMQDVRQSLSRAEGAPPPMPLWSFSRSTDRDGPIVTGWRWLADSSGAWRACRSS